MRQATGWVQRPFDDEAALVLRTTYGTPEAFFECLHHARAVVALNTSAELEAGIVGRPVYTVLSTDAAADGQANTVHFNYLLREHGGFVHYAAGPRDARGAARRRPSTRRPTRRRSAPSSAASSVRSAIDRSRRRWPRRSSSGPSPRARCRAPGAAPATGPEWSDGRAVTADEAMSVRRRGSAATAPHRRRRHRRARSCATAITRRRARHGAIVLPPPLARWLASDVTPGDVVYDIGAGAGECAILAALQRGAAAVAFEPGFAAFKELCENVILNGCGRAIVPLPVALADRAGLRALDLSARRRQRSSRPARSRVAAGTRGAGRPLHAAGVPPSPLDDVVRRQRCRRRRPCASRSGLEPTPCCAAPPVVITAHRPRSILVIAQGSRSRRPPCAAAAAELGYDRRAEAGPSAAVPIWPCGSCPIRRIAAAAPVGRPPAGRGPGACPRLNAVLQCPPEAVGQVGPGLA